LLFQELFAGVNVTEFTNNASSCIKLAKDGHCGIKSGNSFILPNLTMDTLYGVVICAVFDAKNLSFPVLKKFQQGFGPRSEKIYIDSHRKFVVLLFYAKQSFSPQL
jgi:hypothetical protein